MPCGWEQETPVSLLAHTHLTWSLAKQFFKPQFNSPEVISIWTISTCITVFNNFKALSGYESVFNNFRALSRYESLYGHQRFLTIVLRSSERDHLQISNSLEFQNIKYLIFTFLLSWREYISPSKMECVFLAFCF